MACTAVQGGFIMIQQDMLPLEEELVSAAQFIQPVVLFLTAV